MHRDAASGRTHLAITLFSVASLSYRGSVTKVESRLVGRNAELARVATALDGAVRGDAAFILVAGEAGIGKTVVLRTASWLARTRGMRTLAGTAIASGSSMPYLPLVAPVFAAVDSLPGDDAASRTVTAALSEDPHASGEAGAAHAARLVEAIYSVLVRVPTLLVVDDVHWADAATLTVLDYLAHRAGDDRLAVLAAARDDEPGALSALPIADGRRYLQLRLPRLTRAAVQEQIALLAGHAVPDSVIDAVFERSAGNPLYVEELLPEVLAPEAAPTEVSSPASLRSLVSNRVSRLTESGRRVADALAVLGRPARAELVAVVAGLELDVTETALSAAERGGVIVRRDGGHALRHPLFGEALAAELATGARAISMHRRAAERLEAIGASAAEIVRHWEAAGDTEKTWATSLAAATQAEAGTAFAEARLHLERAVAHWPHGREGSGDAMLRAAYAAWLTGDPDAAVDLSERAQLDDVSSLESSVAIGQYLWDAGRRAAATEAFARVAEHLTADVSPRVRAVALWGLGRARIGQGQHDDAYRLALRAAEFAAQADDLAGEGQAWVLAGMSRAWAGEIGGIAELERGFRASVDSGDPEAVGHAYQFLVELLWLAGRLGEAAELGVEGIPVCDRLGLARSHAADLRGRTALVLIDLGEWRDADGVLEGAELRAAPAMARALLALRRGEWAAVEPELEASTTLLSIGGQGRLGGLTEIGRVELAWARGAAAEAAHELEAVPEQPGIWEIDMAARKSLWAARIGRPGRSPIEHFDSALADAINAEVEAVASGEQHRWEAAASAWEQTHRPYECAVALLGAAEAAYQARERPAGRRHLETALGMACELGAAPLIARAEQLGRRARISLPVRRQSGGDPSRLTAREVDVLRLLAEGRTNPQIAQQLFLSSKTVGIHVSHVLEKFDAHTRGEAVAEARRRGLVT